MSDPDIQLFREPEQPLAVRVADLVARLTLDEKIGLLHQHQPAIPRLGLGPFTTGTEALHGLAWLGPATVFPQAVGLASTWNPDLVRAVGAAAGDETRGFHHKDPARAGLNVWAPVVNPLRDPRWGRNEEGYAEDPTLTAVMGVAYARGLRGDHPTYLRTAPTLKHFLAYNNETRRDVTSSNMPPRVLHEYELPAYRPAIAEGAAVAVMGSYNLINGRPAHLSPLINSELRRWTDDEILVVSDAQAPSNVAGLQGYYPDHVTGFAALLRAGVDSFTDDSADSSGTVQRITEAFRLGLLDESDVDTAIRRTLTLRFRLGEFDPAELNPYAGLTEEVINCPAHQELAREAARQGIVLLKNSDAMLPLDAERIDSIAIIGPCGDSLYEDWYSGTLPYAVTVRQGVAGRLGDNATVTFAEGVDRLALRLPDGRYLTASEQPDGEKLIAGPTATETAQFDILDWGHGICTARAVANGRYVTVSDAGVLVNSAHQPNGWEVQETFTLEYRGDDVMIRHVATGKYVAVDSTGTPYADAATTQEATAFAIEPVVSGIEQAVEAARNADVAVVVVGNHPLINGRETEDRKDLALPAVQEELIRAVRAVNPRVVLLVTSSYPYAIGWADAHLPAILWSSHGGQEFGQAFAEVLFGDAAPAGRLTQTWYRSAAELPDLLDYDIIATDATYLYFRGTPLYPIGHGLTYATFEYSDLRLSADRIAADGEVTLSVEVCNTSDRDSDEVVQLYTRQHRSRVKQPLRQLRGFERVRVPAGGRTTVEFRVRAADLSFWDVISERHVVETARHDILVGRSAVDIRLTGTLEVDGEVITQRTLHRPIAAINADAYADVQFVDATKLAGDAVLAAVEGAWIAFEDVDFGDGVSQCTARLSSTGHEDAVVHLRRDDPLDGPIVATLTAPGSGDRYTWTDVSAPTADATDACDLYVVFASEGVCLSELTFARGGA
jgi:beta-glucosidase